MGRKAGSLTAVVAVLLACAGAAHAAGSVFLCVPSAAGKAICFWRELGYLRSGCDEGRVARERG
jgi:hypothetical protein